MSFCLVSFVLKVIVLNVIKLSVFMLMVGVPFTRPVLLTDQAAFSTYCGQYYILFTAVITSLPANFSVIFDSVTQIAT